MAVVLYFLNAPPFLILLAAASTALIIGVRIGDADDGRCEE